MASTAPKRAELSVQSHPGPIERAAVVATRVKQLNPAWRVVLVACGIVVFVVGVVLWASPAPGGFILLAIGLSLVLANSKLAKRRFLSWKRRYPQVVTPLRHLLRRFNGRR